MISLEPEEFDRIIERVHEMLLKREEAARKKQELRPTLRLKENHLEAAKDVFVFVHMLELIEHMSSELASLREIIPEREQDEPLPQMFTASKKEFLN